MERKKTMKDNEDMHVLIPEQMQEAVEEIVGLTDRFCREHLNEEYRQICSDMTVELAELEVGIDRGRPASWASGIVHAAGFVNFLHDPSQSPHMTSPEVAEGFGVSQGNMQSKSRIIREAIDLIQLDPDWCLESLLEDNPLVWILDVDGFAIDIRTAPREAQEEAYRMGLIPYIPADRQQPQSRPDSGTRIIKFPSGRAESGSAGPADETNDQSPTLFDELNE